MTARNRWQQCKILMVSWYHCRVPIMIRSNFYFWWLVKLSTKKIRRNAAKAIKKEVDTLTPHQQLFSCIIRSLGFIVNYTTVPPTLQCCLLSNRSSGESQVVFELREVLQSEWGNDGRGSGEETDSGFVEDKVNLNWRLPFFVEVRHCIFLECSNPFWLKQFDIRTSGPFPPTNADRWGAGKSRRERDRSQVSAFFQLILHLMVTSYIYNTEIF